MPSWLPLWKTLSLGLAVMQELVTNIGKTKATSYPYVLISLHGEIEIAVRKLTHLPGQINEARKTSGFQRDWTLGLNRGKVLYQASYEARFVTCLFVAVVDIKMKWIRWWYRVRASEEMKGAELTGASTNVARFCVVCGIIQLTPKWPPI